MLVPSVDTCGDGTTDNLWGASFTRYSACSEYVTAFDIEFEMTRNCSRVFVVGGEYGSRISD